jgi:competence protein ComEC
MLSGPVLVGLVVAGVAIGTASTLRAADAIAWALATGALAVVVGSRRAARRALLGIALAGIAGAHGAVARDRALGPAIAAWVDAGPDADPRQSEPVRVRGVLTADAVVRADGVRLELRVLAADRGRGWEHVRGRIQAYVSGALAAEHAASWTAGRPVSAPVTLRPTPMYLNPGGASPRWQALRRPFDLTGTIKSAVLIHAARGPWWHEAAARARQHVRDTTRRHLAPVSPEAAAIATAILIGDRAGLDDDLEARLQAAGTYHVIAISGGNIAVLVVVSLFVVRATIRSRPVAPVVTLAVVNIYGFVAGGDPSVQRAVAAASVYLALDLAGLATTGQRVLAAVALFVVVVDPLATVDVGAWLSFGATFAIIIGVARMLVRLPLQSRPLRALVALGAATLAVDVALLPVFVTVFNRVTIAGLVLNFLAIPAMATVQIAGLTMVGLALVWDAAAAAPASVVRWATWVLVESSRLVSWAPWLSWRTPPSALAWVAIYYGGWAAVLWSQGVGLRRAGAGVAAGTALVLMSAPALRFAAPGAPWLRITLIDVGQGDAILLQLPAGRSMLIDSGGGPGGLDVGARVVTPALWALGVRRLDWLVISHADVDHIGGAQSVVRDFRPREIWEGVPVPGHGAIERLQADARAAGAAWRTVSAGERLQVGDVEIRALHPEPPDWERRRVRNDDSLVLAVGYRDVEILLTGDAAGEFEAASSPKVTTSIDRPMRVLKVAHHGSRTSTSPAFVERYRPALALVSAGRGNLFGHPAPDVVARLRTAGADLFRTDRHGAVTVETDGRVVHVRTWRGDRWTLRAWAPARPADGS